MTDKLPEVGKRYRNKHIREPYSQDLLVVDLKIDEFGIMNVYTFGGYCIDKINLAQFVLDWEKIDDRRGELPEDNSSQSEIEKAKEELKLWVDGANTDLIDKNSDIWTLFKKAQNLLNALDNIKTQAEPIVDNKMETKLLWEDKIVELEERVRKLEGR